MSPLFPLLLPLFTSCLADLPHVTISAPTTKLTVNQISPLNFRLVHPLPFLHKHLMEFVGGFMRVVQSMNITIVFSIF